MVRLSRILFTAAALTVSAYASSVYAGEGAPRMQPEATPVVAPAVTKIIQYSPDKLASTSWVNQSGSVFTINSVAGTGELTGSYVNNAQGYGCRGVTYPVIGWVYGTAISFTTIWNSATERCNSVTGWTGYYNNGQIVTNWNLAVDKSTQPSQIISGQDIFNLQ